MTGALHTARIDTIEVIVSSDKLIKVLILAVCRTPVIYELS